jgi:uncharacterized membrane protein
MPVDVSLREFSTMHYPDFRTAMRRIQIRGKTRSIHADAATACPGKMASDCTILIALLLTAAACAGQSQPKPGEPGFDEASIDNVWHQAKLRGVAFRAIGQEPGWLLEIKNGTEILLVTDYGQNRNSYPYVEPVVYQDERRTQYVLESYGVTVEIRGRRCTDVMSGEEFEVSVSIIMTDRRLEGCGRALF